jgi:Zn-dependent peptidase ImmA (M78 family)
VRLKLIRERYPDGDIKLLAAELGISVSALKTIASRYGIRKSAEYWKKQHLELMRAKEQRYLESIREILNFLAVLWPWPASFLMTGPLWLTSAGGQTTFF